MKTIIVFDAVGLGAGISQVNKTVLSASEYLLPEGFDEFSLAERFSLVNEQVVDDFVGKSDEEVRAARSAARKAADEQRIAERHGMSLSSLEGVKAFKMKRIRDYFDNVIGEVKSAAAPYEVETWATQRDEYVRWVADNAATTPYVTALAAARGIPKDVLMDKIGAKVAALAAIQGRQHHLEDLVASAETIQDVLAIEP